MSKRQFDKFGIKHLSANSLNLFRTAPALWVVRYLYNVKDESSPAMQRGLDAEKAVYDRLCGVENPYNPEMIDGILKELEPYGPLVSYQRELLYQPIGFPMPIKGFLDFEFESACVDLKTKRAMPKAIDYSHRLQGAFYAMATGKDQHFLYATDKKAQVIPLEDASSSAAELMAICRSVEKFLSVSDDPEELATMLFPDMTAFQWGDNSRKAAQEIWQL
jgi:hypothetical protein